MLLLPQRILAEGTLHKVTDMPEQANALVPWKLTAVGELGTGEQMQMNVAAEVCLAVQKVRCRFAQGERVPVIHTVGFFAEEQRGGPGERFLRHLSALTGGTFQVSCCAVLCWALPSTTMLWCSVSWFDVLRCGVSRCAALCCIGS